MKLSVVIPAFDNLADVLACLNSLRALQAGICEYIVQDDASPTVHFPMLIPEEIASVQRNDGNVGFGINANTGAGRASGDILFFVNQDCFAWPGWSNGWDAALLRAFDDPSVGVVGARLLFPDSMAIQSAGGLFDGHRQPFHRCLGYSNPHHPDVSEPREVSWVTGAALAIRRDLFFQLGGFDAAYRMYWEDVDLAMRVREAGYKVFYEPRCTLFHKVGSTGGSPYFMQSARVFKERWVDTGKIKHDTYVVSERFW